MPPPGALERLAELAVTLGANLQPGQILTIAADTGHEKLVRAIADVAYRRRARFVDPWYFDPHVKRSRILHADVDTLEFVPSWYGHRALERGRQRCAGVTVTGPVEPGLLDDLDPGRTGRDLLPRIKENGQVVSERTTNWTIVPYPRRGGRAKFTPTSLPTTHTSGCGRRSCASAAWTRTTLSVRRSSGSPPPPPLPNG